MNTEGAVIAVQCMENNLQVLRRESQDTTAFVELTFGIYACHAVLDMLVSSELSAVRNDLLRRILDMACRPTTGPNASAAVAWLYRLQWYARLYDTIAPQGERSAP